MERHRSSSSLDEARLEQAATGGWVVRLVTVGCGPGGRGFSWEVVGGLVTVLGGAGETGGQGLEAA